MEEAGPHDAPDVHEPALHEHEVLAHERAPLERHSTISSTNPRFRCSGCPRRRWWPSSSAGRSGRSPAICSRRSTRSPPGAFPWVTLLVNLTGSFAIGLAMPLTEHVSHRLRALRPLLVVGFLGGWTTYSTLAVDATLLAGTVTSPAAWPIWPPPSPAA